MISDFLIFTSYDVFYKSLINRKFILCHISKTIYSRLLFNYANRNSSNQRATHSGASLLNESSERMIQ